MTLKAPRDRLRSFMDRKHLTQDKLAKMLGVSRPAISLLLSDENRQPSLDLGFAIERVTGIPAKSWTSPADSHRQPA